MTNKKLGNDFESKFCKILFNYGFWVHNLAQNQAGQPADVIAVRDGKAYLIDCKVCSNGKFSLSRMEENQNLSMEHWLDCRNGEGLFAIQLGDGGIYLLSHLLIQCKAKRQSALSEQEIRDFGVCLPEWLGMK